MCFILEQFPHTRPLGPGGRDATIASARSQENGDQIGLFSSGDPTALPA